MFLWACLWKTNIVRNIYSFIEVRNEEFKRFWGVGIRSSTACRQHKAEEDRSSYSGFACWVAPNSTFLYQRCCCFFQLRQIFKNAKIPPRKWKTQWEMKVERDRALQTYCCSYKFVFLIFILLRRSWLAFWNWHLRDLSSNYSLNIAKDKVSKSSGKIHLATL